MDRFSLDLVLRDNYTGERLYMRLDLDQEVRIATRAVDEVKAGLSNFSDTVELMQRREFRKDLLIDAAVLLARQMAERMEDAEDWHDASRIEPARKALKG